MTCKACGDPIDTGRSYGRFHRRCVEQLLAAQRSEIGPCPCPCHRVIQPGLVPCPTCGSPSEHLFDRS